MDMQTPSDPTDTLATSLPRAVLNCLLRMLAAVLPNDDLAPDIAAENWQCARTMFFALQPRDAAEAAAAVRAVAAHFAAIDMHYRAFRPGLSDDTAMRLRASANTCARAADAGQRALRKPPVAAPPKPRKADAPVPPSPAPAPSPPVPLDPSTLRFYPRDRYGNTIRLWQPEQLTKAQLYAALACPRDPELEAAAIAEEEAMIAEQAALDAAAREAKPPET